MPNKKVNMVGTMPRSGTNLLQYFLHYYEAIFSRGCNSPHFLDRAGAPLVNMDSLGGGPCEVIVGHGYCPGFDEVCSEAELQFWSSLAAMEGYDAVRPLIDEAYEALSPLQNPAAKIVFIYRNPFDQSISLHEHVKNFEGQQHLANLSCEEFFGITVYAYAKLFFSYMTVSRAFPDNILMVPYETLVKQREKMLQKIVSFLGFPPDTLQREIAFQAALWATHPAQMRRIEQAIGHTLANDQPHRDGQNSHVRNGVPGLWKTTFAADFVAHKLRFLQSLGVAREMLMLD